VEERPLSESLPFRSETERSREGEAEEGGEGAGGGRDADGDVSSIGTSLGAMRVAKD
jgi:hypothetical protein